AFRRLGSSHKWLEVHGRKKWEYFYQPESVDRQRRFFDHFLKGVETDVLEWPRVRLEVRDRFCVGEFRSEAEWPLARTRYRQLYPERATPEQPWLLHRREQRLSPGDLVPVEIEIWPSGTLFHEGESLRLVVQGADVYRYSEPIVSMAHTATRNTGAHVLHTG